LSTKRDNRLWFAAADMGESLPVIFNELRLLGELRASGMDESSETPAR
jgi:hypothetical protein